MPSYMYGIEPIEGSLGQTLRRDRIARGLSQAEVAEAIGTQQGKLSSYELGRVKSPPPDRLVELARLYGKPDDHYLGMAGIARGASTDEIVAALSGALVVKQPREGMADLVTFLQAMPNDLFASFLAHVKDEWQYPPNESEFV